MGKYVSNCITLEETEELLEWLGDDPVRAAVLKDFQDTWDKSRHYPSEIKVESTTALKQRKSVVLSACQPPVAKSVFSANYVMMAVVWVSVMIAGSIALSHVQDNTAPLILKSKAISDTGLKLVLDDLPLAEALKLVEKQYHVRFYCNDGKLLTRKVTATFNNLSADRVAQVLAVLIDGRVEQRGENFFLLEK